MALVVLEETLGSNDKMLLQSPKNFSGLPLTNFRRDIQCMSWCELFSDKRADSLFQ